MSVFITFEGVEGCGKSTQARLLYEHLYSNGLPVILVREPGGTRISDVIRKVVLDLRHTEMLPVTEIMLFSAARAQLVGEVIRPYLAQGGIVICDRYADSTYAYQGYGLGRPIEDLRNITQLATGGLEPTMTLFLDLSAEEGLDRKQARRPHSTRGTSAVGPGGRQAGGEVLVEWNRLDARELAFHQRVESGYRELMARDPNRWHALDARQPIEQLAAQIRNLVAPHLRQIERLEKEMR
jgi:dTMP kinase